MILLVVTLLLFSPNNANSERTDLVHLCKLCNDRILYITNSLWNYAKQLSPQCKIKIEADVLRLKCDTLLYRSVYNNTRCYFAAFGEVGQSSASPRAKVNQVLRIRMSFKVPLSEAAKKCSLAFPGSKVKDWDWDESKNIVSGRYKCTGRGFQCAKGWCL